MSNTISYFKLGFGLIVIATLVWLVLSIKSCWIDPKGIKNDTISIKHDTAFISHRDTVYFDNPVPYKVVYQKEIVLHDTLEKLETITEHVDTARILNQYFAKRYYSKTSKVQYGTATIIDTVTQNRITGRSIILNQKIPEVTKTVTLTEPKRIVLYAGLIAIGNKDNLPYASGISLDLKLKNDGMIGAGALLTRDQPMFLAEIKFPIRLRKK